MNDIQEPTSLKGVIQSLQLKDMDIIKGVVILESPLEIEVIGDEKLILTKSIICLPKHLTNYKTTVDIMASGGNISGETQTELSGGHTHSGGEHGGHESGGGEHSHGGGEHSHGIDVFNITGAEMTVYNALKTGDIVFMLSFNRGAKYYILDRE